MSDLESFARLIRAIEPWRAHLVLVGGWAHRLYRFHDLAVRPSYRPLTTRDTDFAFANRAPMDGDIKAALTSAGFTEEFAGDFRPPAIHYTLGDDDEGFYAEFLTPLIGSGRKRSGEPDATMLKAGISAQKLRYLELLLMSPWTVRVGPEQGIPLPTSLDLQVANPASFIVQKLLIRHERLPEKRAQDVLYIHDTLELFDGSLSVLRDLWTDVVQPQLNNKATRGVLEGAQEAFSKVDDVIRNAARIPVDRRLSPERMQAMCDLALAEMLATSKRT